MKKIFGYNIYAYFFMEIMWSSMPKAWYYLFCILTVRQLKSLFNMVFDFQNIIISFNVDVCPEVVFFITEKQKPLVESFEHILIHKKCHVNRLILLFNVKFMLFKELVIALSFSVCYLVFIVSQRWLIYVITINVNLQ